MAKLLPIGDLHFCEKAPAARKDENWVEAQMIKLNWVVALANKEDAQIVLVGDIFDKWKVSLTFASLIGEAFCKADRKPIAIPGNHDLPSHSFDSIGDCAYWNLASHNVITDIAGGSIIVDDCIIYGEAFGYDTWEDSKLVKLPKGVKKSVLLLHELVWDSEPFPGAPPVGNVDKVINRYSHFNYIFSGDNHQAFHKTVNKTALINVGSLMRRRIDQIDYQPAVNIIETKTGRCRVHLVPLEGTLSRTHLVKSDLKEKNLNAFIDNLDDEFEVQDKMKENAKEYFKLHKTSKAVQSILLKAMEA